MSSDQLYVSEDRCTFVRIWASGVVEVARRTDPGHVWGPPVICREEITEAVQSTERAEES